MGWKPWILLFIIKKNGKKNSFSGWMLDNSLTLTKPSCTIHLTLQMVSLGIINYNGIVHVWNAGYWLLFQEEYCC